MGAQWDDVAVAVHVSAYSLKALADAFVPLMTEGGAFVGLDFDNRVAWPAYNWMGVAKSALQSVNRYLAKELGPRGIRSQPRRRRAGAHDGGQEHPRLRQVRGHLGRAGAARLGHRRSRCRSPRRASPCCRTGSRPRPARSSTSTAASTPSGPEAPGTIRVLPPTEGLLRASADDTRISEAARRSARTRPMAIAAPTSTMTRRASQRSRSTRSLGLPRRACARPVGGHGQLSTAGASSARSSPRRGHRRPPARRASGRRRPAASAVVCNCAPRSSQLGGDRLEAVGDAPQVLGGRRPVAGDEPLDALDDAGDPIGEAGQPRGGLGQLVLRPPRRAARRTTCAEASDRSSVGDAGLGGAGRRRRGRSSSRRSGRPRRRRARPSRRRRPDPSRYVVPTRCTSTSPRMTAHRRPPRARRSAGGRDGSGRSVAPSGQPCRAAR